MHEVRVNQNNLCAPYKAFPHEGNVHVLHWFNGPVLTIGDVLKQVCTMVFIRGVVWHNILLYVVVGLCTSIHMRFSWPSLAYMCTKVA